MTQSKVALQMRRIQYTKPDKSGSSLTIDPTIFNALEAKTGNAKKWCQSKVLDVINELEIEAAELKKNGLLIKLDNLGNRSQMTEDEYIRGKISAGVRRAATLEVINPEYLK